MTGAPMPRKNRDPLSIWIAGGDLLGHRITMVAGNLLRLFAFGSALWLLAFTAYVLGFVPDSSWDLVQATATALIVNGLGFGSKMVEISVHGREFPVLASDLAEHVAAAWNSQSDPIAAEIGKAWSDIRWAWAGASLTVAPMYYVGYRLYMRIGAKQKADEFIRGQKIVPSEALAEYVSEYDNPSPIKIGEVPIPAKLLARNILAVGSMGTGKSQAILHMMDQARAWGKKMVIYDKTGEFTQKFYRPGIDVILNPVDARCENWTIFNEVRKKTDPAMVSKFFVPENKKSADPVWDNSARMLLEDLIKIALKHGETMAWVEEVLTRATLEEIYNLLKTHGATSTGTINHKNERGAESIRLTLTSAPAIRFFPHFDKPGDFSVREFVSREDDACIFIVSNPTDHELIKPFASAWIELALLETMSKSPTNDIRLMFFLDELASLSKIPSLDIALTEARKYGICTLIGIQNLAQLVEIYGREMTQTYVANLQNKLILRTEETETAKNLATTLGMEDISEVAESQSFGAEANRDGVNMSGNRKERYLVTPTEISTLPDLVGWLKIAGEYPITKIKTEYKSRPDHEPALVMREGLMLDSLYDPDSPAVGGDLGGKKYYEEEQANDHEMGSDVPKVEDKTMQQREQERYVDDLGIGL